MLYELLTGTVPFEGESVVAIALQHLSASRRAAELAGESGRPRPCRARGRTAPHRPRRAFGE